MRAGWTILLIGLLAATSGCSFSRFSTLYVVGTPIADLREKPQAPPTSRRQDPDQATQLLYGERVRFIRTKGDWSCVEAVEQREYTHRHRWEGYFGWILSRVLQPLPPHFAPNAIITQRWTTIWKDEQARTAWFQVPMGTRLDVVTGQGPLWRVRMVSGSTGWVSRGDLQLLEECSRLSDHARRLAVIHAAEQLLGDPYFWGGRSPSSDSTSMGVTGVDCSGLVNLSYRTAGIDIPRDAHEQYLRARPITHVEPGDLVFLSDAEEANTISHVMLYAGDGWLIEAPGTGQQVRRIEVSKRLGRPIAYVKPGSKTAGRTVYFGAYLP